MVRKVKQGIAIDVKVRTKKPAFSARFDGSHLHLELTGSPVMNEANKEIISELAKLFGVDVRILSGHKDRNKTVLIVDLDTETVKRILKRISSK